ncbi:DUF72 domain-containing protein [Paraburkholderia megapolitana]|uniref:DUF72 domain-containing protein n=1 Tax=Paraburkholderia megapolitana TaxID=420953 RepID=A0A1I3D6Z3_9BURK|nr:DUF72 domain-containing protein [Paraburkholderia megapolitana]QDQ81705.1 DUF72 domain-containing protein [Paraburkholderia megapolitana]SFH82485.1 Protein of unknown function DUF72 [Paraburkholderia megapolitana]
MSIRIGTASWTDATLIKSGRFYPKGCTSAEARLRFYASQFALVEVDSSYYAMPSASNSALWVERTPDGFIFNMKAFRLFTGHQTERKFFPKDLQGELPQTGKPNLYYRDVPAPVIEEMWARYFEAIEPLRAAGKLGAVLFQFAPWMTSEPKDRAHVEHCAERMHPYLTAFEFRSKSWADSDGRGNAECSRRRFSFRTRASPLPRDTHNVTTLSISLVFTLSSMENTCHAHSHSIRATSRSGTPSAPMKISPR